MVSAGVVQTAVCRFYKNHGTTLKMLMSNLEPVVLVAGCQSSLLDILDRVPAALAEGGQAGLNWLRAACQPMDDGQGTLR